MHLPKRPRIAAPRAPALRIRDFRLFMAASFSESIGSLGEQVAVGWLVLELTDDPFMVGVALGLRFAPFFFLGILAGTVADMVDRRNLMRALNIALAASMLSAAALIFADMLQVWHLFALSVVGGCFSAIYQTARQSFVFDIVGRGNLVNGLAYSGLGMRLGGLAGSLAAGYLIADVGVGAAYVLLASGYIASAGLLSAIRSRGQAAALIARQSALQNLKDFWGVARRHNALLIVALIVAATEMLGFSSGTAFPSLARDVLGTGADGLGWMNAVRSGGAVAGILILSLLGEVSRRGAALLFTILGFGAALALLGQSGALAAALSGEWALVDGHAAAWALALTAIAAIGAAMALSDVLSQSLMQNIVPNEQRGRAMGAWVVGIGTAPVGNLQVGALAAAFGVGAALTVNGAALAAVGAGILLFYRRMRRM